MSTVFLAIPHHVFTSDLLRTKYIEYLATKHRVVVLTPFIDEMVAAQEKYFHSPNVVYKRWDLQFSRLWGFFKTLRISLVNEFDYLASIKFWYLRPNYKGSWQRRILRFFGRPFSKILTADFFTRLESALLPRSEKFDELRRLYRPQLLVTATPGFDSLEAELIILAKRAKLPTVAVNFTWDNLTTNSKHIRKTDYLIAWNSVMKKEAVAIHNYPEEKVFVSGTPRFDPYFAPDPHDPGREKFLKSKNLNPAYKTIFHTTVTKAYPFQKKYIRDLIALRDKKIIPYVNIFIRIHPLDNPENYREFSDIKDFYVEKAGHEVTDGCGGKKIEMSYDDLLNLKYSLKYTDVNINYASTISIEACIFDKPIINIGYIDRFALAYQFTHYQPIVDSGAVKVAKTDDDLPKLINMYLQNPAVDRDGRRKIVKDYVQFTDGLAYKRNVDYLDNIMRHV